MARKMTTGKVAWVLLVLCLLWGAGGSGAWAQGGSGVQLVVVLDSSNPTGDSQINNLVPQAASLLVHLLGDQDYLGLVGSGQQDGVLLPTAGLSPEHRKQALDKLAQFASAPDQKPLGDVMQQALGAFQPQGPQRRVLFWLAGNGGLFDDGQKDNKPPQIDKIAAQARSAGVTIFAALMAPPAAWRTLAADTGGRCWEIKSAADLQVPCLKLYQYLAQPQEAPINGSQVLLDRWVEKAVLVMTRSDPEKAVVLANPRRARLTDRTRARNVHWMAGRSCDLITLEKPRPGVWSFTGAQPEACKVFLSTELMLTAEGTPRKVAEDETLPVTASLDNADQSPVDSRLLAETEFSAELQLHDTHLTTELKAAPPEQSPETPAARTGRFPPLHQQGEGTLRLLARGKNFQRLRSLSISITRPWYQVAPRNEEAQVLPLHFQPDPERRPEQVAGTLTLKSALGSLSGVFINPVPGAEIILDRSPGSDHFSLADLYLKGTAPDGRPLAITSGPLRLQASKSVTENPLQPPGKPVSPEEVQAEDSSSLVQKFKRRWVWLALCAVGGGVLLVCALLLWRLRGEAGDFEDEEDLGSSPTGVLRLKAQVETLAKEKGELETALKEKNQQISQLQTEKTEIEADLERTKEKVQTHLQSIKDLEKKLEDNEQEAARVREEYMALYARNQREQEAMKKN